MPTRKISVVILLTTITTSFGLAAWSINDTGTSGAFFALTAQHGSLPLGVKMFKLKNYSDARVERDLEYEIWKHCKAQLAWFKNIIKNDHSPTIPRWWKEQACVGPRIMHKKMPGRIVKEVAKAKKAYARNAATYHGTLTDYVLVMEKLGGKRYKIGSEKFFAACTGAQRVLRVGQLFLLMTLLGIIIDDTDIFFARDGSLRLVDFGEWTVLSNGHNARTFRALSYQKINRSLKTRATDPDMKKNDYEMYRANKIPSALTHLWGIFATLLSRAQEKKALSSKKAAGIRRSLQQTYDHVTGTYAKELRYLQPYKDMIDGAFLKAPPIPHHFP